MQKKALLTLICGFMLSILTFCTGCQYVPDLLKDLGKFQVKESLEIDIEPKSEFPEHCNKDDGREK
jgi:hypothetical protein